MDFEREEAAAAEWLRIWPRALGCADARNSGSGLVGPNGAVGCSHG